MANVNQEQTAKENFENELDASFWNQRWHTGQTGWDIGYASPPITQYLEHYTNKNAAILIPGCGNAYEAEYLATNGFTNVTLVDIAEEAVARLAEKFKNTPQVKVLCEDFFHHQGQYDLIIEQTFFCAQVLERRKEYVQKMASLLRENGLLMGVLFGVHFEKQGPPFGGNKETYEVLFRSYFQIEKLATCYNSIHPRAGTELFFVFKKK
jgi:SAM-dependent methyltransferase